MADAYDCSGCKRVLPRVAFHETTAQDRLREVTSQCRECRSESYFKRRYPETKCAQCLKHRPIDSNKNCPKCNEEGGLRECHSCLRVKSSMLDFYGSKKRCHDCAGIKKV